MSKQDRRNVKAKEGICPYCGYDCYDKDSLVRHVDWSHSEERDRELNQ